MKDELGQTFVVKIVGLRAKTYSYIIDDGSEDKKARQEALKSVSEKENLNLKIIKTVIKDT